MRGAWELVGGLGIEQRWGWVAWWEREESGECGAWGLSVSLGRKRGV